MNHSRFPSGHDPSYTFTFLDESVREALVVTPSALSLAPRSQLVPEDLSTAAEVVVCFGGARRDAVCHLKESFGAQIWCHLRLLGLQNGGSRCSSMS